MPKQKLSTNIEEGDVIIRLTSDRLIIAYDEKEDGSPMTIGMDVSTEEWDLINAMLMDVNLWANFLNSLSAALTQHK